MQIQGRPRLGALSCIRIREGIPIGPDAGDFGILQFSRK